MKNDDITEKSMSPWNAPLLLVKKKYECKQEANIQNRNRF